MPIRSMKVLSGESTLVPDAKQYLQEAEFAKLPDDPRLANMKAIWDMEVVFFTRKANGVVALRMRITVKDAGV